MRPLSALTWLQVQLYNWLLGALRGKAWGGGGGGGGGGSESFTSRSLKP